MLLLHAIFLGFGISALCLLAGISLTAMVAVLFYKSSPATALMVIAGLDLSAAWFLYRRLHRLLSEWRDLPSSLEQLRKDRSCLQDIIN